MTITWPTIKTAGAWDVSYVAFGDSVAGTSGTVATFTVLSVKDADGDGFDSIASGGTDCDDTDDTVYPGAPELCDGQDNNCDGDLMLSPGLIDNGNGTITDRDRGIMYYDYSYSEADADGLTCTDAGTWIDTINAAYTLGFNDWRLPSALNSDGSGPCYSDTDGPCDDSELGHLHLIEDVSPREGEYGPFSNLQNYIYWTSPSGMIYAFQNIGNEQHSHACDSFPGTYAIAVRDVPKISVEVDHDGDGYVECTGWVGPSSILGGGDCNESDVNINPGASEQLYNGIDDDCNESTPDYEWTITTPISGTVYNQLTMGSDPSGNLHIAYLEGGSIKHATNASGSWVSETVTSVVNSNGNPSCFDGFGDISFAIDPSSGDLHMRYGEHFSAWLGCSDHYHFMSAVKPAGGSWSNWETYTTTDYAKPALAMNSAGDYHSLTCSDSSCIGFGYGTNAAGYSGEYFSSGGIDFDIEAGSNNGAHISYYETSTNDLMYAVNDGVTAGTGNCPGKPNFDCIIVDSTGDVGSDNSIDVDSNNKSHISYYDSTNGNLKYATNSSGSWVTTTVDSTAADTGRSPSVYVDSSNNVYISYVDITNGAIRYASNSSGSWVTDTVEASTATQNISLVIDSSDYAHISYPGSVKYATNAPDADGDGFTSNDCDDSDANTYPGAAGLDSATACMKDTDGDEYGDLSPPPGVTAGTDCDDGDPDNYPGNTEVCDGQDNDCNAGTTDGSGQTPPGNSNQEGVCSGSTQTCSGAGGWVDDYNGVSGYEATETTCDGLDNDCDGTADNGLTAPLNTNQEGVCSGSTRTCSGAGGWVDDYSGVSGYELTEVTCDGLDNDCDNQTDEGLTTMYYEDFDGDTYGNAAVPQDVCAQPAGFVLDNTDCNDIKALVYPGASEICDGDINNCNNPLASDGEVETWYEQPTSCGVGACVSTGQFNCTAGAKDNTCIPGTPVEEGPPGGMTCKDDIDNDCDGVKDYLDGGCFEPEPEVIKFIESWPAAEQSWFFNSPNDVVVNTEGAIYVADTDNHRIHKFSTDGKLITRWGSYCSITTGEGCLDPDGAEGPLELGDGQFDSPTGMAVDSSGSVYVVDAANNRVQKFTPDGRFLLKWGSSDGTSGSLPGEFNSPASIAAYGSDPDNIVVYVVDSFNNRVQQFTSDGANPAEWGTGLFNTPGDMAVDSYGFVYVVNEGSLSVLKFASDGTYVDELGIGLFNLPAGIAIDDSDIIYVADEGSHSVKIFASDGTSQPGWGTPGSGDGELNIPNGVAVDSLGYVYVSDDDNRIQKFTSDGQFIINLGSESEKQGDPNDPYGIAMDSAENVYVADRSNNRIQKFSSGGALVTEWGTYCDISGGGTGCNKDVPGAVVDGDGQFNGPWGIEVDIDGNVYITDSGNHRVQKFTPDGNYLIKWGRPGGISGNGNGEFNGPTGIAVDDSDPANIYIYITDTGNNRIQKFTSDGVYVTEWGSPGGIAGDGDGEFNGPTGIAVDSSDPANIYIYVTDGSNNRVQKFTPEGEFVTEWGSPGGTPGSGVGQFDSPAGVEVDDAGFVYVVDLGNHRVKKFTQDGQVVAIWGEFGSDTGSLNSPQDIAVTSTGDIYVSDTNNHRIQLSHLVSAGSNNKAIIVAGGGPFAGNGILDATYKSANFAYRTLNYQGFDKDRIFYMSSDDLDLDENFKRDDVDAGLSNANLEDAITDWASDADSLTLYLVDHGGNNIFRMSETEMLSASDLDQWLDTFQSLPCPSEEILNTPFSSGSIPEDWTVTDNTLPATGAVWRFNAPDNRGNMAGGTGFFAVANSDYEGFQDMDTELRTPVLDASKLSTVILEFNMDFRWYPFSRDETADVDVSINGGAWENVWTWTGSDLAGPVSIDITLQAAGENDVMIRFHYYNANYEFWWQVDDVKVSGDLGQCHAVTVVYDACESGSFISALTPLPGKDRIVITSTDINEQAKLALQGTLSFSEFFWTGIFNGSYVKTAFDIASDALTLTPKFTQTPQLNDNGNNEGNENFGLPEIEDGDDGFLAGKTVIGNGTSILGDTPGITGVYVDPSPIDGVSSADIVASGVTSGNGIAHIWAVILSDDLAVGASDNPISDLPHTELLPVGGGEYRATYDGFTTQGTYSIIVFEEDWRGNTKVFESIEVNVTNPPRRRAILVAAGPSGDPLWPVVRENTELAYNALIDQGYTDEDIKILSPEDIVPGFIMKDADPTGVELDTAIRSWAAGNTHDLVLYMIGNGNTGTFEINDTETLSAGSLDQWLDELQDSLGIRVTVVYDASRSGSFIPYLDPPLDRERIVITSTGTNDAACFLSGGSISFSKYFWIRVMNGENTRDAYLHAKQAMNYSCIRQRAEINDDGNTTGNESRDGRKAHRYTIGAKKRYAGNDPMIGSVTSDIELNGITYLLLRAENVTSTGTIPPDGVWAVITPPRHITVPNKPVTDLPEITLWQDPVNKWYENTYNGFTNFGIYKVAIYVRDIYGNLSELKQITVNQKVGPDTYEDDDSASKANVIVINDVLPQQHNFHDDGVPDEDWVKFYGVGAEEYEIKATPTGPTNIDLVIEIFDSGGMDSWLINDGGSGAQEMKVWTCPPGGDGIYYMRVTDDTGGSGENTGYDLSVSRPTGDIYFGTVEGIVKDSSTGLPLKDVPVVVGSDTDISRADSGYYSVVVLMNAPSEGRSVSAAKTNYNNYSSSVTVTSGENLWKEVPLEPTCSDGDGDGFNDSACGGTDCNDGNTAINPDTYWYLDGDGDGYGTSTASAQQCTQPTPPPAYVLDNTDCNDGDLNIYPGGPEVRILSPLTYYSISLLRDAYVAAGEGGTIQSKTAIYTGDFAFDRNKTVTFEGGYNCSYTTMTGETTIGGNVTVGDGMVTLENIEVQ